MLNKVKKSIIYIAVAVFLFSGISIGGLAVLFHRGIHIQHFSWKSIEIQNGTIYWDNKLSVLIETLNISSNNVENSFLPGITDAHNYLLVGRYAGSFIASIDVEHLNIKEFSGQLNYTGWGDRTPGVIHLSSTDLTINATVQKDDRDFVVDIRDLSASVYNSVITGSLRITKDAHITGEVLADIAGKLPLSLSIVSDSTGISFDSKKNVNIDSINPVVELFRLSPAINPWITEYLKGSNYQLTSLKGSLLWGDPSSFLENLKATVRVQDCQYTFAQGLEPIKSEYTDVVFNKSMLNIYPRNARFYGQDLEKSWVKIDFTQPFEPILTVFIDTHASVNDDIIKLLNHYSLRMPFKQLEGKTATDLVLEINLSNLELNASATFKVDQGVFVYEGKAVGVSDCVVSLKNTDLTIQRMEVTYLEIFKANARGHIALNRKHGDITVTALESSFKAGESEITLKNDLETLTYVYHIRPGGDTVESTASTWQIDSNIFHLAQFTAPFNLQSQVLSLPPTSLKTTGVQSESMLSGEINLRDRTANLHLDFNSFRHGNLELNQPHWKLMVQINQGLKIDTKETSRWLLQNIETTLSPIELKYKNDELIIQNGKLTYGDFFEGSMDGAFNFKDRNGSFVFSKLNLKNDTIGTLFSHNDGFEVLVSGDDKNTTLRIPLLDVTIDSGEDNGWHVNFHDLSKLTGRFPFLKRYYFSDGSISIGSKNGKKPYHFKGAITSPYSILVVDDSPVNHYGFSGTVGEEEINAKILEELNIIIDEKISITSENIEFNIIELVEMLKNLSKTTRASAGKDRSMDLELMARNSSLYFRPEIRVLADSLQVRIEDGKTSLWLEHELGKVAFVAEDGVFSLEGENLDDSFMEALLADSNFNGGDLSFSGSGNTENFDVRFKIKNTVLQNYAVMNNVLAFVDTIPALITFSVPDYNSAGMVVDSAVLDLSYDDSLYTINSFDVKTSVLTMRGNGNASLAEDNIDLKLNLITKGRKNLSKIPLVGYILVGDEKVPTITLKVTGKLSDPDIQNSAFEEVVTLPFDIGLRILKSPFKLIENLFSEEDPVNAGNSQGQGQQE